MAASKKDLSYIAADKFIFAYLALFPLGQLLRLRLDFFGIRVPVQVVDLLAGSSLVLYLFNRFKKPEISKYIFGFLLSASFSLFTSLTIFGVTYVSIGALYLFRLFIYAFFFLQVASVARVKKVKDTLFNSLILVCLVVAILGWIQYFWLPDLTTLKLLGWDDHLYRLVGTFLDPGFTGIILVFGFLLTLVKFVKTKEKKLVFLLALFLVSLAFTYSRASYLALLAGLITAGLAVRRSMKGLASIIILVFLLLIPFLPRPSSEGVKLERLYSVYSRFDSYSKTLQIWKKSPLLGVGFNNLCIARQRFLGEGDFASHSCSGSDAGLLLVLATTGVVGFLVFIYMVFKVIKGVKLDTFGRSFILCLAALGVHSLFVNSLFYPWVMGFMGILLAISLKEKARVRSEGL